jgi:serine/threonine protein kinase
MVRDVNAVHVVFSSPVVCDLSSSIRVLSSIDAQDYFKKKEQIIAFTAFSLVSALEVLHQAHIVYRAVQPESLYIDMYGRIVLVDFRVCKVGLERVDHAKTFTVCGAADYLAPEQISQLGHSYPVDMWALGVLLYEIAVGSHPFSSTSEIATYSKISSFGSKNFSFLPFPIDLSSDLKSLINQLLMPVPAARIGSSSSNGFQTLKKHRFFRSSLLTSTTSTSTSATTPTSSSHTLVDYRHEIACGAIESPFKSLAIDEANDIVKEGVEAQLFETFCSPFDGDITWLENIEF